MLTMPISFSFFGFAVLTTATTSPALAASCDAIHLLSDLFEFHHLQIAVHRNGEPDACAILPFNVEAFGRALSQQGLCDARSLDKYDIESLLTAFVMLNSGETCGPPGNESFDVDDDSLNRVAEYCDSGLETTPLQLDHGFLKTLIEGNTLPCRFYTREGRRVDTLASVIRMAKESASSCSNSDQTCSDGPTLHLTAVPAGRVFMFAPSYIGEKFVVHLSQGYGPVVVETLSVEPRVFELHDFFTQEDVGHLVREADREYSDSLQMKQGPNLISKQTGVTAIVTDSKEVASIKKRALELLGLEESSASQLDDLHLQRYEAGQASATHSDLLTEQADGYNVDSAGIGSNRFATLLLYMNELGENDGGETVFEQLWPVRMTDKEIRKWSVPEAVQKFRDQVDSRGLLKRGSWEERMAVMCSSRFTVRPKTRRAILLYSQLPNGQPDKSSMYGECPVLNGTKWEATLRAWSAPRVTVDFTRYYLAEQSDDDSGDEEAGEPPANQLTAEFWYTSGDPRFEGAGVYYESGHHAEDVLFGTLSDLPVNVNTFEGHRWYVQKGEVILKTFVIGKDKVQVFEV